MADRVLRGRSEEMSTALGALTQAARRGEGGVVAICGEAGMGKTAMLEAVREQAVRRGFEVGFGKADEVDQVAAGAPVLLALRSGATPLVDEVSFRRLADVYDRPLWLVDEIADLLEDRTQRSPLLIVLDDMQWADTLSWFILRVLTGRLSGSPVVWLLATRDTADRTRTQFRSAETFDSLNTHYLVLDPLDESDVAAIATDILGTPPAGDAVARLARAGGNPFLVVHLVEGLAGSDEAGVPLGLAASLREQLIELGPVGIDALRLAAVWGHPLSIATGAEMVGVTVEAMLTVRGNAVARGLVADTPLLLEFRHDLVREFVYADIDPGDLLRFHRRCLDALVDSAASAMDAVPHARALAPTGHAVAIDILRRAAREHAASTPRTAAFLALQAFQGAAGDSPLRLETGEQAAEALIAAQSGAEALAVLDSVLPLAPDGRARAAVTVLAARALLLTDDPIEAQRRIDDALALPDVDAALRSRLEASRAMTTARTDAVGPAARAADRALARAQELGDRPAEILAREALAELAKNDGRHLDSYAQIHQLRLLVGARYLADEIMALQFIDRFDDALALLAEAAQGSQEQSAAILPSLIRAQLWQDFKTGHWDEALADAQTLVRVGEELGNFVHRIDARVVESAVAVVHDDLPAAEAALASAEREQTVADPAQLAGLALARARLHLAQGDVAAAAAVLKPLLHSADTARTYWPRLIDHARLSAGVAMATGDDEFLHDTVAQASSAARRNPGIAGLRAAALHVEGYVNNDPHLLSAAVTLMRSLPRPFVLASALFDQANILAGTGALEPAVESMDEAWAIFVRIEAKQPAEEAQRALVAMGRPRRPGPAVAPRPISGWGSLTRAEKRVARLITAGHTNRSTALELGVSIHTVSTHLRAVFAKMDVRSRVQLTNEVRGLERQHQ